MRYATSRVICLCIALALAIACKRDPPKPAPIALSSFEETIDFGEVYPLADGNAYVSSFRSPIYYIANGVATRIVGLPPGTSGEITALADGTALFLPTMAKPPKLYWLQGSAASVVAEGSQIGANAPRALSLAGFLFAENQRLRRKLAETSDELAAMQGPDEPDYEQEEY